MASTEMVSADMAEFLTTDETARAVGLSHKALWQWTTRLGIKKFGSQEDGRERLYAREDVEKIRNRMAYIGKGLIVVEK